VVQGPRVPEAGGVGIPLAVGAVERPERPGPAGPGRDANAAGVEPVAVLAVLVEALSRAVGVVGAIDDGAGSGGVGPLLVGVEAGGPVVRLAGLVLLRLQPVELGEVPGPVLFGTALRVGGGSGRRASGGAFSRLAAPACWVVRLERAGRSSLFVRAVMDVRSVTHHPSHVPVLACGARQSITRRVSSAAAPQAGSSEAIALPQAPGEDRDRCKCRNVRG
jgi:hypothetical protein